MDETVSISKDESVKGWSELWECSRMAEKDGLESGKKVRHDIPL